MGRGQGVLEGDTMTTLYFLLVIISNMDQHAGHALETQYQTRAACEVAAADIVAKGRVMKLAEGWAATIY